MRDILRRRSLIAVVTTVVCVWLASAHPLETLEAGMAPSSISASSATGGPGENISISVSINDGSGVLAFGFDLTFDSATLNYNGTSKGNRVPSGYNFNSNLIGGNKVRVGGYSGDGSTGLNPGGGTVAVISFQIKNGAPMGTSNLTLSNLTDGFSGLSISNGSVTVQVTVKINSFTASPGTIARGGSSTLSWSISDATSASINQDIGSVDPVSGSVEVSPNSTKTYTLTAQGPGGPKTARVTVTVDVDLPTINSFTANPGAINSGGSSTLSWNVENADGVSIDNGIGSVNKSGGSVSVSPGSTTTYTLTATSSAGSATAWATVNVMRAPEVNWFFSSTSARDPMHTSEMAYLSWSVDGADIVRINNSVGSVACEDGFEPVSPNRTTTYRLTATNSAGTSNSEATVHVTDRPRIRNFSSSPASAVLGQAINFYWTVAGADTLEISPDVGSVSGDSGTVGYQPNSSDTYTLRARNSSGSDTATVTVHVVRDAPDLEVSISRIGDSKVPSSAAWQRRRTGKSRVGTETAIEVRIRNTGSGDAGGFVVRLQENGIAINEVKVPNLVAGETTQVEFSYTPLTPGVNTVEISADPDGALPELNRTNNTCLGRVIAAEVKGVDLVISHVRISRLQAAGSSTTLQISFRITNCGSADSTAFQYRAYITRKANRRSSRDTLVVEGQLSGLDGNGGYIEITGVALFKKLKKKFYFQGFVDVTGAVSEANEANNNAVIRIIRKNL